MLVKRKKVFQEKHLPRAKKTISLTKNKTEKKLNLRDYLNLSLRSKMMRFQKVLISAPAATTSKKTQIKYLTTRKKKSLIQILDSCREHPLLQMNPLWANGVTQIPIVQAFRIHQRRQRQNLNQRIPLKTSRLTPSLKKLLKSAKISSLTQK